LITLREILRIRIKSMSSTSKRSKSSETKKQTLVTRVTQSALDLPLSLMILRSSSTTQGGRILLTTRSLSN